MLKSKSHFPALQNVNNGSHFLPFLSRVVVRVSLLWLGSSLCLGAAEEGLRVGRKLGGWSEVGGFRAGGPRRGCGARELPCSRSSPLPPSCCLLWGLSLRPKDHVSWLTVALAPAPQVPAATGLILPQPRKHLKITSSSKVSSVPICSRPPSTHL